MTPNEAKQQFVEEARGIRGAMEVDPKLGAISEVLREVLEVTMAAQMNGYQVAQLYYRFAAWMEAQIVCSREGVLGEALEAVRAEMVKETASYNAQAVGLSHREEAEIDALLGKVMNPSFGEEMN